MYTKLLQLFFASALVQFSLFGQNGLDITTRINGNYDEQRSLIITVNDPLGEIFSFEKKLLPHQSIPQIEALSNNSILLVHSLEGLIEIYNSKGSLVSKNEFYKLPPYNEQRILFKIFDSGITLLVSESQRNNLYILDNNGNINYSKNIKDGLLRGLVVDKNADFIACSIMNWDVNNLENEIIFTDTKNNSAISISGQFENGMFNEFDNLFLGFTNKSFFLFNRTEQKTVWSDKLDDSKLLIDGEIFENKTVLIQSDIPKFIDKKWVFDGIKIIQKDEVGNEKILLSASRSVKKIEMEKVNNKLKVEFDDEAIEIKID